MQNLTTEKLDRNGRQNDRSYSTVSVLRMYVVLVDGIFIFDHITVQLYRLPYWYMFLYLYSTVFYSFYSFQPSGIFFEKKTILSLLVRYCTVPYSSTVLAVVIKFDKIKQTHDRTIDNQMNKSTTCRMSE